MRLPGLAAVLLSLLAVHVSAARMFAQESARAIDWTALEAEALDTLQRYVRIDTSVPPGDVTKAADFLQGILEREGIPVKRYESGPGRTIVLARLKGSGPAKPLLLLHHMDVVPVDRARWSRDPFGAEIAEGKLWGRGAFDMKGAGVAQLYAFLALKRQRVPLARDVLLMAVPDEEIGGALGATWMLEHHLVDFEPEYILDEGGFGTRDLFSPGKLVFGISVAEKKMLWL
jgi:acetylornithine deacetylase/succinyl-diaminopimelate desuccinylase-like protein